MTANNTSVFDRIKDVLFRPGRVDKQLNITYCTKTQISKIIANFYDLDVEDITDKIENIDQNNITPATIIKHLQDYYDDFDGLCNFWNSTKKTIDDNEIIDSYQKNTIKSRRLNTNTIEGINSKLKIIKSEIKCLEKKNKKMEKNREDYQSKIDKNNKAIINKNNDLDKFSEKLTLIKINLLKPKQVRLKQLKL